MAALRLGPGEWAGSGRGRPGRPRGKAQCGRTGFPFFGEHVGKPPGIVCRMPRAPVAGAGRGPAERVLAGRPPGSPRDFMPEAALTQYTTSRFLCFVMISGVLNSTSILCPSSFYFIQFVLLSQNLALIGVITGKGHFSASVSSSLKWEQKYLH